MFVRCVYAMLNPALSRHTRNQRRICLYYFRASILTCRMRILPVLCCVPAILCHAQAPPPWVARSNQNAQLLIDIEARYSPEGAASSGVRGLDEQISIPGPENRERALADYRAAKATLESRLSAETDPLVKQDLEILIHSADFDVRRSEATYRLVLPYS